MRKVLMSLLMAGSLIAAGVGPALADDAASAAAASAPAASAPDASAAAAPAATASAAPDASAAAAAPASAAASAPADASAAAAPAAPTAPFSVDSSKISAGDTAWMLTSTALVLFMTIPGLALFYAGMVRKKNVLATVMQSFAITALITVLWTVIGYSLAFTPGNGFIGGLSRVFLHGMNYIKGDKATTLTVSHLASTIPESVYFVYQMTFAIITPALICGAFADRMKFSAMLVFMTLWSLIVYVPIAHMVWEPTGWLSADGVLDFAGGTVVQHQRRYRGPDVVPRARQARRLRPRIDGAAQPGVDDDRRLDAVGRLVRFQRGLGGCRRRPCRLRDADDAGRNGVRGARLDVCRMDREG